ncbi:MAG: hypothetical protein WD689_08590 [Gaiellaceae bacterium]
MRRLLALLGGIALVRAWLARRRAPQPLTADPRAEELRRRLDESRVVAGDQEEFASGETPVDAEGRRREVHERGRSALDEMRKEE